MSGLVAAVDTATTDAWNQRRSYGEISRLPLLHRAHTKGSGTDKVGGGQQQQIAADRVVSDNERETLFFLNAIARSELGNSCHQGQATTAARLTQAFTESVGSDTVCQSALFVPGYGPNRTGAAIEIFMSHWQGGCC